MSSKKISHFGKQVFYTGLKRLKRAFKPFKQQRAYQTNYQSLVFSGAFVGVFVIGRGVVYCQGKEWVFFVKRFFNLTVQGFLNTF